MFYIAYENVDDEQLKVLNQYYSFSKKTDFLQDLTPFLLHVSHLEILSFPQLIWCAT